MLLLLGFCLLGLPLAFLLINIQKLLNSLPLLLSFAGNWCGCQESLIKQIFGIWFAANRIVYIYVNIFGSRVGQGRIPISCPRLPNALCKPLVSVHKGCHCWVPKSNVNRKPIKGIQQLNCQIKYRTTCIHELQGCVSPSESPRMTGCTQATDNILKLSAFVSVSAFYHIFVSLICHISTISWVVINILKGFTEWAHKYLGFSLKVVTTYILKLIL